MAICSVRDMAAAVRGRRQDLGLSQADLAHAARVSRKWIYEFEGGKPTAEWGMLLRVLDALDLDLDVVPRGPGQPKRDCDLDAYLDEYRGR